MAAPAGSPALREDLAVGPARASLTVAQKAALAFSHAAADINRPQTIARLRTVLDKQGLSSEEVYIASLVTAVKELGRIDVHFHPDRLILDGRSVVEALLAEGIYKSQFETRISNGGLTAHPGGDRHNWEDRLFGSAYSAPSVTAAERPKYGALDLLRHSDGAAPRFGSCYLRLKAGTMARATFSMGDSYLQPTDNAPIESFGCVLAGLLEAVAEKRFNLGVPDLTVSDLVSKVLLASAAAPEPFHPRHGRSLDQYIEVQLHGPLNLNSDVECIVADPAFRTSKSGLNLFAISAKYSVPLIWHCGFHLPFANVPSEFRGPAMPLLAERLKKFYASKEELEAGKFGVDLIGRAAESVVLEPERWADWGTSAEALQHLKQMWHVLVHVGELAEVAKKHEVANRCVAVEKP